MKCFENLARELEALVFRKVNVHILPGIFFCKGKRDIAAFKLRLLEISNLCQDGNFLLTLKIDQNPKRRITNN